MLKEFFIGLSQNQFLNAAAQKYGLQLGAQSVVAGTDIHGAIETIKELNKSGISATVDNLGEFVHDRDEATAAKDQILNVVEAIHEAGVDAHVSLKASQLGLDIDYDFALSNLREIVGAAAKYDMFVNIDMEDYARLQPSFDILDELSKDYGNVGTVIQAYFHRAEDDIRDHKDYRLRIVKGAYKEPANVAYTEKEEIDRNFIKLIEYHLLHGKFTSVATHDHHIIDHVKKFAEDNNISRDKFEFQMLYGFRRDMQYDLAAEGYNFTTYVPFGKDWYGYFMRRLAERPQNLNLVAKQVFTPKTNGVIALAAGAFLLGRMTKRRR